MNETYVECLVKQKQVGWARFLKLFLIVLTVILGIAMFIIPFAFLFALASGFGAYAVNLFTNLEFEYLYLDRELVVDKIMAQTRRKRVGTYSLDRVEVLAPINSYHLDNYKNRQIKAKDYSIGQALKPDKRYVMYVEGNVKIILSPSEEMVKVMKNAAPRKIFND